MAGNTLITPTNVAKAALATYQYNAVLPRLVNRSYVTEFGGGSGDTVTIRKQAKLTTNKFVRTTGIVVQDVTEGSVQLLRCVPGCGKYWRRRRRC